MRLPFGWRIFLSVIKRVVHRTNHRSALNCTEKWIVIVTFIELHEWH